MLDTAKFVALILVGSNPGMIFLGFASPIPEPSVGALAALGLAMVFRRRRNTGVV